MNRWMTLGVATVFVLLAGGGSAQAWDLFRSENKDVKRGNELLERGKSEEATAAYESAQRTLPNDPGVQLNKGLGLLGAGKLSEAREAFRAATQAPGPELRSKANYNLGLTFLHEADALAKEEKLEESQKRLTESIDAFKNSLRNAPKNHDAAWNLELAKRRLVDLKQKKEQKEQEQREQEQKQKDQEQQDQEQNDPQDQGPQDQDAQNQDAQGDQPQDQPDPEKDPNEPQDQPKDQDQPQPEQQDKKDADQKSPEESPEDQAEAQPPPPERHPRELPEHMQRALDALSESDDNLQKHRARARARQRPQRVEKDW